MRTIKMTTGAQVTLDGDLLSVLETLYHELTAKRELERPSRTWCARSRAPSSR